MSGNLMDDTAQREATRIVVDENVVQVPSRIAKNITIPVKSENQKGYAFILNHETYESGVASRSGTEYDAKKLETTLSSYNLNVVRYDDLSIQEIGKLVQQLKTHDFENDACVFFSILTHGNTNNVLYASDREYHLYDFIIHPIVKANKTLLKKPKIFVIQACKGTDECETLVQDTIGDRTTQERDGNRSTEKIPSCAELMVCFATYEGQVAWRYTNSGTPFIQELCKYLDMRGTRKRFEDIMKDVSKALQTRYEKVQLSSRFDTMTTNFSFRCLRRFYRC